MAAANKAWDDQVKAVTDSAEAALDAGISKVSQVVRRCAGALGWVCLLLMLPLRCSNCVLLTDCTADCLASCD